ncbi:hypothetical protein LTR94_031755, partial [Friedmanniomyces endolithicus]
MAGCALLGEVQPINWSIGYLGRSSLGIYLAHPIMLAAGLPMLLLGVFPQTAPAFALVFMTTIIVILLSGAIFKA